MAGAYRERQRARLCRNLRLSLPAGAVISLGFIPWNRWHDPTGALPAVEIGIALSAGLLLMFGATWSETVRNRLNALTIFGCLYTLTLVSIMLALLPEGFLYGVGTLLALIVVMTVVASDLSTPAVLICAVSFFAVPNAMLLATNADRLVILNTNWILIPGVAVAFVLASVMDRTHRHSFLLEHQLIEEKQRGDALLSTLLPARIAERLKHSSDIIADVQPHASVLFADLVGFTRLTRALSPGDLIGLLTHIFTEMDEIAEQHGLEKIKTIGDAYMVAAGVADAEGRGALEIAEFALVARGAVRRFSTETGYELDLRIGIATGAVVCGVIGRRKPYFDLWGTTVNRASRLEMLAPPGGIQLDDRTARELSGAYLVQYKGEILLDGLGRQDVSMLLGTLPGNEEMSVPERAQSSSIGMFGSSPHSDIDPS